MCLTDPIFNFPYYQGMGADFEGGIIRAQRIKGAFFDFYLALSIVEGSNTITIEGNNGICLCFSIMGSVNIQYDSRTGIHIPTGRFNLLPITTSEIFLEKGATVQAFIKLPKGTLSGIGFNFPFLTDDIEIDGVKQQKALLKWRPDSYDNQEVFNTLMTALNIDYPLKEAKRIFANIMYEIITKSVSHLVNVSLLKQLS
jgi:hypothetical protein